MIKNFVDRETERLWQTGRSRRIGSNISQRALDKLQMLNAANTIEALRVPPSNHLEKLSGDLAGLWSIRINRQYRIAFKFTGTDAHDVRIIDYH